MCNIPVTPALASGYRVRRPTAYGRREIAGDGTRDGAERLARRAVGWRLRRWRDRCAEEVLDALDQHRIRACTVLNLAANAESRDFSRCRVAVGTIRTWLSM
jgi:hypothetical protein